MNLAATLSLDAKGFINPLAQAQGAMTSAVGGMKSAMGSLAGIAAGVGLVGGAFMGVKKAITEAANMEQMETGFSVLLGGMKEAKDRMTELAKFSADTPFDLPGVAAASRTLETLTHGALSTGKGLTLVGDVASGTQQSFEDLAVTIGRLYDGLQNGRAVGESMARLQELGAISGEVRAEIEGLQAAGQKGDAVWQLAAGGMSRYTGMMKAQSGTWNGLMSNLQENISTIFRAFGTPLIDGLKPMLNDAINLADQLAPKAREWGQALSDAVNVTRNLFDQGLLGKATGLALKVGFLEACDFLAGKLIAVFDAMAPKITGVFDGVTTIIKGLGEILAGTIKQGILGALSSVSILGKSLIPQPVAIAGNALAQNDIANGNDNVRRGSDSIIASFSKTFIGGLVDGISTEWQTGKRDLLKLWADALPKPAGVATAIAAATTPVETTRPSAPLGKGGAPSIEGDRLAKIGLIIGGGGPATEFARRTAENTARMQEGIQRLLEQGRPTLAAGNQLGGPWA